MTDELWRARDRAWKLGRERNHWKSECLEQARLLAISADREEKLRGGYVALKKNLMGKVRVFDKEVTEDGSRWSAFNEGRASACLEVAADIEELMK